MGFWDCHVIPYQICKLSQGNSYFNPSLFPRVKVNFSLVYKLFWIQYFFLLDRQWEYTWLVTSFQKTSSLVNLASGQFEEMQYYHICRRMISTWLTEVNCLSIVGRSSFSTRNTCFSYRISSPTPEDKKDYHTIIRPFSCLTIVFKYCGNNFSIDLRQHSRASLFRQNIDPSDHIMECSGLVSLFNGISTFIGYLMPKLFS